MIDFAKGWGVHSHEHGFYQIWYVLEGRADYILDGKKIEIKKDHLIFIRPKTTHELPVISDGLLRYVDIKFQIHDETLCGICNDLPDVMLVDDKEIREIILKCREYWYDECHFSRELAGLAFEQMLLLLVQKKLFEKKRSHMYMPQINIDTLRGLALDIANYINEHYAEDFELDDLSAVFNYNKTYLCKVFKEASGMTIRNYLNYVKISRAYDLICYTSNPMSQISQMTGFSSAHYFARTFRRICGIAPSEIRELHTDSIFRDTLLHGTFNYRYYAGTNERKPLQGPKQDGTPKGG